MITETRKIYKCDHCRKLYQIKSACEKHEKFCVKNPENYKACYDCKFYTTVETEIHQETIYGEHRMNYRVGKCTKLNKFLYPLVTERKNNAFLQEDMGDGEIPNEPMPHTCDSQENEDFGNFEF